MPILLMLALMAVASPVSAQTFVPAPPPARHPFIEGGILGEYFDAPVSLNGLGASGEFGLRVWDSGVNDPHPASVSLRGRVERLFGDDEWLLSFLVAPELALTRRVSLEAPIGFTTGISSTETVMGIGGDVGVPIALNQRVAIVPRGGGFLFFSSSGMGMMTTVGLGLRVRL